MLNVKLTILSQLSLNWWLVGCFECFDYWHQFLLEPVLGNHLVELGFGYPFNLVFGLQHRLQVVELGEEECQPLLNHQPLPTVEVFVGWLLCS